MHNALLETNPILIRGLSGKKRTPYEEPEHSFADLYGEYVSDPKELKESDPQIYNFMRSITSGYEYAKDAKDWMSGFIRRK